MWCGPRGGGGGGAALLHFFGLKSCSDILSLEHVLWLAALSGLFKARCVGISVIRAELQVSPCANKAMPPD